MIGRNSIYPRKQIGPLLSLLALVASLVAPTAISQAQAPGSQGCLRFDNARRYQASEYVLDVATGRYRLDEQVERENRTFARTKTGDGRYTTYILQNAQTPEDGFTLFVEQKGGKPVAVETDIENKNTVWPEPAISGPYWQPGGGRLAYAIGDVVTIYDAATGEKTRKEFADVVTLFGWSSSGAYLAFSALENGTTVNFWSVPAMRIVTRAVGDIHPRDDGTYSQQLDRGEWAPRGNWFAYMGLDQHASHTRPFLASPDNGAVISLDFKPAMFLERSSVGYGLTWSPDGRYIALHTVDVDQTQWHLDILGVDGTIIDKVSEADGIKVLDAWPGWSTDSRSFWFWHGPEDDLDLIRFYPAEKRYETILQGILKPTSIQDNRLAISTRRGNENKLAVDLIDIDGRNRVKFLDGADEVKIIDAPLDSPTRNRVVSIWATGQGAERRVRVTWARPDGTGRRELDDQIRDIRHAQWMDGDSLAFAAERGDGSVSLETLSFETGTHRRVIDGLTSIHELRLLEFKTAVYVIRYDARDQFSIDLVNLKTGALEHITSGLSEDIVKAMGTVRVRPSPDGRAIVFIVDGENGTLDLELTAPGSKTRRVIHDKLDNTSSFADFVWATWKQDGRQLAISYREAGSEAFAIELLATDGTFVRRFDTPPDYVHNLRWAACK